MADLHVLVALDGSAFSRSVLSAVESLFDPDSVRLTLLRVGETPRPVGQVPIRRGALSPEVEAPPTEDAQVWPSQEWESARQRLKDDVMPDASRLEREGWTVEVATSFGEPAEEIVAWCDDHRPDLVAMATHGRSGLSRALVGSVAERALRHLSVPVLMLRPKDLVGSVDEPALEVGAALG